MLSPDLQIYFLSTLDKVTATYLSLTCRRLYGSYRRVYAILPNLDPNHRRRMFTPPPISLKATIAVPVPNQTLHPIIKLRELLSDPVFPYNPGWKKGTIGQHIKNRYTCHDYFKLKDLLKTFTGPDLIWGDWVYIEKCITEETFEREAERVDPQVYQKDKESRCRNYDGCLDCRWIRREIRKQGIVEQAEQAKNWSIWCRECDFCPDCRRKILAVDEQKKADDPEG